MITIAPKRRTNGRWSVTGGGGHGHGNSDRPPAFTGTVAGGIRPAVDWRRGHAQEHSWC